MQNRYRKNCNPDCLFKSFVGSAIMKRESNAIVDYVPILIGWV